MTIRHALERERTLNHTWDGRIGVAEDLQRSLCCPSLLTMSRIRDISSHLHFSQARIKAFNLCSSHFSRYVQVAQVTRRGSDGNSFGAAFGRMREHAPRTFGAARSLQIDASCADLFRRYLLRQDAAKCKKGDCTTSTSAVSSTRRGPDSQLYSPYSLLRIRRRAHTS
jgi:hypothetical protein